ADENIITGLWNGNEVECVANQIVIRLAPDVTIDDMTSFFAQNGINILKDTGAYDVYLLSTNEGVDLFQTIEALNQLASIKFAEPNLRLYPTQFIPDDDFFNLQWHLHSTPESHPQGLDIDADIDAPEAWDYGL
ncbi:MAG: hypothetical protein GY869_20390, partial [Planctomycetes bacterium]|nr:hypothetical protein [Planctomycetota bacterium]